MNRGFSIVQLLISIGLVAIIIISGFKIFEGQTRLGKSSSFIFESIIVMDEMKSLLSDHLSCQRTFSGKSSFYDEVQELFKYDTQSDNALVEYKVMGEKSEKLFHYGQGNVSIQSLRIYGDRQGFDSENGHLILKVGFKEVGGNEEFVGQFPISVKVNELGRILDCEARPGLNSEEVSRETKGPWVKMSIPTENEKSGVGAFYGKGKVIVGDIDSRASLNVQGGVAFVVTEAVNLCDESREGSLVYESQSDSLLWCRKGSWQNISEKVSFNNLANEFTLEGKGPKMTSSSLSQDFSYCTLKATYGGEGECRAQRVDDGSWQLLLKTGAGRALKCEYSCF